LLYLSKISGESERREIKRLLNLCLDQKFIRITEFIKKGEMRNLERKFSKIFLLKKENTFPLFSDDKKLFS